MSDNFHKIDDQNKTLDTISKCQPADFEHKDVNGNNALMLASYCGQF